MKVNVTVELSKEEVLAAIGHAIRAVHAYKYSSPLHEGEALDVRYNGPGTYQVDWGESKERPEPPAVEPKAEPDEAASKEPETKIEAAA